MPKLRNGEKSKNISVRFRLLYKLLHWEGDLNSRYFYTLIPDLYVKDSFAQLNGIRANLELFDIEI